ncbi:MAG: DUF72 domain-containing protein [bacterium]
MNSISVGTSGWSYPSGADKWRGVFYPPHVDELSYYSERLPVVEVNSTFYRLPEVATAYDWTRRTPAGFRFAVKLFMKFTHPGMYKHTSGNEEKITPHDVAQMRGILDATAESGKLLALLLQYPDIHIATPEHRDKLAETMMTFREYPLAVELRHPSWDDMTTTELLRDMNATRVKIDSPIYSNMAAADDSGTFSYYRLHGRNTAAWHQRGAGNARYDYLYTADEISNIGDKLRESITERGTVVFFNNHPGGKALVNAVQLSANLGLQLPYAKFSHLARSFPQLIPITGPAEEQLGMQL